jgi:hypothetical protein
LVQGDTQAFIVRIWHEAEDDEGRPVAWRGSVQQVGSDSRLYFQELDGIVRFIQEQTGIKARRGASKWRKLLAMIRHEIG